MLFMLGLVIIGLMILFRLIMIFVKYFVFVLGIRVGWVLDLIFLICVLVLVIRWVKVLFLCFIFLLIIIWMWDFVSFSELIRVLLLEI